MSNFVKIPIIILIVIAVLAILFLVAIPAFLKHQIKLAPAKVVPTVSDMASTTSFFETRTTFKNTAYNYIFTYPAEHTPYSEVTPTGALVKAGATSKSVSIARDETKVLAETTEIFRIRAFPEFKKANLWIDAYYPNKSEIVGNKVILFGGYSARDVVGKGSTSSPARIMVVETPKGVVAIEQNVKSDYLNAIFSSVEFGGSVAWVPIAKKTSPTRATVPEPVAWVPIASSSKKTNTYGTKTGQFKVSQYKPSGVAYSLPTDFSESYVAIINGVAYELPQGEILVIAPPDTPRAGSPAILVFVEDRRASTIEEWYLRYYDAKGSVVKTTDFAVDGLRAVDIMGAGTLQSPYRTRIVDRGTSVFVAIEVIRTSIFDYILSSLRFGAVPVSSPAPTTNTTSTGPSHR